MVYEVDNYYSGNGVDYYDYIAHYGIHNQKWGVRRFQNPDGSLTAAGRERYGYKPKKDDSLVRRMLNDPFGLHKVGTYRQHRLEQKAEKARAMGNDKRAAKATRKAEAQAAANDNRTAWDQRQKSGRLATSQSARGLGNLIGSLQAFPVNPSGYIQALQQVMSGSVSTAALKELTNITTVFNPAVFALSTVTNNAIAIPNYRHARARGSGVARSLLESGAGLTPIGTALRIVGDKNAYGATTWFS